MFELLQDSSPMTRRLLFGNFLSSLGSGLTLPLLIVYLHQIREISLLNAALVVAWMSIFGLVTAGPVGTAIDRFGPKPVIVVGLLVETAATASWSLVQTTSSAYLVGALSAIGQSALWAPQSTMLARMVAPDKRQNIFGVQFMFLNLGLGVGGLLSALIVDLNDVSSFVRLYTVDSLSYLIYLVAIAGIPNLKAAKEDGDFQGGSYRDLIKDRRLIYFFFATLLMLTCGYGSMTDAGLAPLLTIFSDQSVKVLGPIWAVNTGIIVIGQLYFIKRIQNRSRSRLLQIVCVLWALAWVVLALAVGLPGILPAVLAALAMGIFAIGEMIWSPVGPAILNDMAPEHLRGRYNAVSSLTWVLAGAIGPAFAGLMLDKGLVYQWIGIVAVGCFVSFALMIGLRAKLTDLQDGLG